MLVLILSIPGRLGVLTVTTVRVHRSYIAEKTIAIFGIYCCKSDKLLQSGSTNYTMCGDGKRATPKD